MYFLNFLSRYRLYILILIAEKIFLISVGEAQVCSTNIDYGKNIVCNGDFEQGDYCFITDYIPFSKSSLTYSTPDYYLLGGNPTIFNTAFSGSNHTVGGNKFLMVDGSCVPNKIIWKQTVTILPNTNYFFSAWISTLQSNSPAQLQFSINGIVIGSPFGAPGTTNTWASFTQLWNSGSLSGPIVIEIINLTTAGCGNGNDFGIDDISFIPGCKFGTPGPQPNLGPDIYLCSGGSGVLLNSGLKAPYTNYNIYWNTGEKTPTITITTPGKYSVCVDSAGSCTRSDVIEVIAGNQIKADFVAFPLLGCSPLVVWAKNQTKGAPLTFQWYVDGVLTPYTADSLPRQTFSATGTSPVIHTIKLIATNNCGNSDDTTVQVTVYPPPQINAGPDTSVCNGESVQLKAYGGGTYSWTPSTGLSCTTCSNPLANPGYTITYSVNVINTNGCSATDNVTYTALYNLNLQMRDTALCAGKSVILNSGIINATSYNWSPSTGLSCTSCANPIATPTSTTTYNVNVSKGSCSGNGSITITIKKCAPTVVTTGIKICSGTCGSISATATGGLLPYTYLWNTGATASSVTLCPATTTSYTVTITDGSGVSASATAIITVNQSPTITASNATICNGACANITAGGGISYSWAAPLGVGSSQSVCPTATTTYSLTGTDANGCSNTATTKVTINPIPIVSVPNASICSVGTTSLTASGATTYTWSPITGLSSSTGTTVTASPTTTTTYTIVGTDVGGCTASTTAVVSVGELVATVSPNTTICFGDSISLTASGGVNYSWTPVAGLSDPTISNPIASPRVTTTYTVVVSDATCSNNAVVAVTVNPAISLNIAPFNVTCYGACNGQTIVIPTGGNGSYTYSWSGGCTQAACSNVCAGTYTLIVTDGSGCSASGSTTVTEPPVLTVVNTFTKISCFGTCDGTASVTASGVTAPYTYAWTPIGGAADNVASLCAGSYTCTITDANNCSVKTSVTITQPTAIIVTSLGAVLCPNECASLNATGSGGSGAISFSWNPGGLTGIAVSVCPVTTTVYAITGTDGNGCTGGTSVTVSVNPMPIITVPAATVCEKTSTSLTASGANTYKWSPALGLNPTTGATVTANPTATSTYTIIGTSAFGCTNSTTVLVTVNPAPIISTTGGNACPRDPIALSANGASSYTWSPAIALNTISGSNVIATPAATIIYTVTGIGANGCTAATTAAAIVNPKPFATFTTSPDKVDEFNPTVYFNDNSIGGVINSWNWKFGDSANTSSSLQNPIFIYPPVSKLYSVQLIVTNQFGCVDTVLGTAFIHGIFTFYIPNTFTPNNDGNNDGFLPMGVGIDETDYHLWIFDRWGNLIWQTIIWGEAWDGRANKGANVAQIDTYVWKVHVREKETGAKHNYIGHVNILK